MKYLVYNHNNDAKWECNEADIWKYVAQRLQEGCHHVLLYDSGTYWILNTNKKHGSDIMYSQPVVSFKEIEEYVLTVVDDTGSGETTSRVIHDENIETLVRKIFSEIQTGINIGGSVTFYDSSVSVATPSGRKYLFSISKGKCKIPVSQYMEIRLK